MLLGIDPGYGRLGYGLISYSGTKFVHVDHGIIETDEKTESGERLLQIHNLLSAKLKPHAITHCVLEQVFFRKNLTTGVMLLQARGVIMMTLAKLKIHCTEITPTSLKKALTGNGTANKSQMQAVTCRLLGLKEIPQPDDAADALGLAICAAFREKSEQARQNMAGKPLALRAIKGNKRE